MRGQLTLRGVVIGVLGCVIITASSAYTALKMGALPWPIIFAAVISLFFLKLMGNASLNEANVTHTIMSAGAMVAGGLAFTIPGAWMLGYADQISWLDMFIVALAGTILGLLATALIHRHFIVDAALEFPTGNAADTARHRGRRQDRQAALWLHGHRRHLQRASRRSGRGAQHAVHAQYPRRDLCHL